MIEDYCHGKTRKNTDKEMNKKSAFICEDQWQKEKDYSHGLTRKNTDEEFNINNFSLVNKKKSAFICEDQWQKKKITATD